MRTGGMGPGSGNHWSDQYRSEGGNFMLGNQRSYDRMYGTGAYKLAIEVYSNPVARNQWMSGSVSLDKGFWMESTRSYGNSEWHGFSSSRNQLTGVEVINKFVRFNGTSGRVEGGVPQGGGVGLPELSAGTERGIGLGGSLWGGAATMTYADEVANGVSVTSKGMTCLRVGGNTLGGLGFAATSYNNVVKIQNGTFNTADAVDWGFSGGMLFTGLLVSNPVGLTVLAVGGIGYGVYRLAAGDAADEWINENFGFRP